MGAELAAADREELERLVREQLGHRAPPEPEVIEFRLLPVMAYFGAPTVSDLVARLRARREPELITAICEALLNHETSFFREPSAFTALKDRCLPALIERRRAARRLDIWSAAASSGQEAYSMSILLAESFPELEHWDVRILATDYSEKAIERARAGSYNSFEVQRGLSTPRLLRHFVKKDTSWLVHENLRRRIRFERFNLRDWKGQAPGPFDIVLLRYVLIYLDDPSRTALLERVRDNIRDDGFLFLGGAESVMGISTLFVPNEGDHVHYRPGPASGATENKRFNR